MSIAATEWKVFAVRGGNGDNRFIQRRDIQFNPDLVSRQQTIQKLKHTGELLEIEDHPFLTMLRDANPFHVGTSVRRLQQLYLELTGEYFAIIEREPAVTGIPVRMWPVPPHWISETPTPKHPFYRITSGALEINVPFTEVIWIQEADPVDPYGRGIGISQALGDELDIAEYVQKFTKAFFWNSARPDILIMKEGADPEQMSSLQNYWDSNHRSFWKAFRPLFLNFEPTIKEFQKNLSHLQITELSNRQRDTIIQVFGVPPEVLGIVEDSNRATITAATHIFATEVLVPRLELLRDVYQERVIPEYDDRLIVDFVTPVEADREFHLEVATVAPWSLQIDEWRKMMEMEPLPDGKGEIYAVPFNIQFVEELADAGEEEIEGAPPPELEPPSPGEVGILGNGKLKALPPPLTKQQGSDNAFYVLVHRVADRLEPEVRRIFLDAIDATVGALSAKEINSIIQSIRAGNAEGVLRRIPWDEFTDKFAEIETPIRRAIGLTGQASATELSALLGQTDDVTFSAGSPAAIDWARQHSGRLVRQTTEGMRLTIRAMVARGLASGEEASVIADRILKQGLGLTVWQENQIEKFRLRLIAEGFNPLLLNDRVNRFAEAWRRRRAITIARTETINAANMGMQLVWEAAERQGKLDPRRVRKVWVVTPDDRLDTKICEPMPFLAENQNVPINGFFTTGTGELISQPTAHPLCRCSTALELMTQPRGVAGSRVVKRFDLMARALERLQRESPEAKSPSQEDEPIKNRLEDEWETQEILRSLDSS